MRWWQHTDCAIDRATVYIGEHPIKVVVAACIILIVLHLILTGCTKLELCPPGKTLNPDWPTNQYMCMDQGVYQ